jgi:sulfite reductase (NADPH) hemoprotein beta-component
MYRYDEFDRALVHERVEQFRRQVKRRLDGELSEDQFKPLRLMNGLYLQLHAYMLRINIPYGCLSSNQIRTLAHCARVYDRGYGHFTTRQNIQYHWPKLEEVPDFLLELADAEMHGIQSSGNCIRNITSDPYAGCAADELEDPRIYCEIIRQWSTLHPEFSYLPRKFKIAVTGAPNDRAAVKIHDIGLRMHRNEAGEPGFEVLVGGGLGRTPFIAKTVRKWLPKEHLLSYVEAVLRIYNQFGRRDNIYKARIKVLIHEMGTEKLREMIDAEWEQIKDSELRLPQDEIDRITRYFAPPDYDELTDAAPELDAQRAESHEFDNWVAVNVVQHKVPGYAIANISLKAVGETPGDISADQMDAVADLADRFNFGELRTTHVQNLVFTDVKKTDLHALWQGLVESGLATPNIGLTTDIICCPGLDYCALANARSIPLAQRLSERFDDMDRLHDIGELQIKMSGCINACGHHHVGHIGILGVDKKGEEFYQITLGGTADETATLGKRIGRGFSFEGVIDVVEEILNLYLELREPGERFIDTYRRVGDEPFKDKLYAVD